MAFGPYACYSSSRLSSQPTDLTTATSLLLFLSQNLLSTLNCVALFFFIALYPPSKQDEVSCTLEVLHVSCFLIYVSLCSKLQSETLTESINKVLGGKKRRFLETIELQIGLKGYDPSKDKRFSGSVVLPAVCRPKLKVCVLGDELHCDEAKEAGLDFLGIEDLKKYKRDKKMVKKLGKLIAIPRTIVTFMMSPYF